MGVPWDSPTANLQELFKMSTLDMSLKINNLRLQPHVPDTNELLVEAEWRIFASVN